MTEETAKAIQPDVLEDVMSDSHDNNAADQQKQDDDVASAEKQKPVSTREEVMRGIYQSRKEVLSNESRQLSQKGEQDDEDELDESKGDGDEEAGQPAKKTVKIVVGGEELEVEEKKIYETGIRALQKEVSGDAKLEEAARVKVALDRRQAELEARARMIDEAEAKLRKPKALSESVTKLVEKFHEATALGDVDAAAEAFGAVVSQQAKVEERLMEISENQQAVTEQIKHDRESSRTKIVSKFVDKYPELANDAVLWSIARAKTVEIQQAEPHLSSEDVAMKAGEEVMKWWSRGSQSAGKDVTASRQDLKRSMPRQPQKAGAKQPAPLEKKPKTGSDIVRDMRKARGLL